MKLGKLRLEGFESHSPSLGSQVDRLSTPVLLVDGIGAMRHANWAGTEALRSAQYLMLRNGFVRPRSLKLKRPFANMLAALLPDDSTGTTSLPSATLSLFDVEGNEALLVAQSLRGMAKPGGIPREDAVLFLINPAEKAQFDKSRFDAVRLQIAFGFTSAETRLARYLMCGMNLAQIGEQLHLSRETLKTQLRALFHKTGTNRQSELIVLLLSSTSAPITCP